MNSGVRFTGCKLFEKEFLTPYSVYFYEKDDEDHPLIKSSKSLLT